MESQGPDVCKFISTFLTKGGSHYGEPFDLLPFQEETINHIYALDENGRRKHKTFLYSVARKNGKTSLAAALAVYHLIADPADKAPVVITAASSRDQARLVFSEASRMISMSPDLREVVEIFRSELRCKLNGGVLRVVSSQADNLEGLSPTFCVIDEFHTATDKRLFDTLTLGSATRNQPLTLVISTSGSNLDSPLGELYRYGRQCESGEVDDPSFGMAFFGPDDNDVVDHTSPEVWAKFNPAFQHFMNPAEMESACLRTHENAFRRYRLNQWTRTDTAWIGQGVFENLVTDRRLQPGERIVLGMDMAWQSDSSAIVACSVDEPRHVEIIGLWEKPDGQSEMSWRTPISDVMATIYETCEKYSVVEIAADVWRFEQSLATLSDEGFPVVEFSTNSVARMTQATQLAYDAIIGGDLTHTGDPALCRHVANAVLREDPRRGSRLTKDRKGSTRKIDACIAMIIALHRAAFWRDEVAPETQLLVL